MADESKWMRVFAWIKNELPWAWIVLWLLIPNIVILLMWPIGGPPMKYSLMLFGCIALAAVYLKWALAKRAILALMMVAITVEYVCISFNLPVWGVLNITTLLSEMRPWRVPLYLAGAIIFAVAFTVTLIYAPRVQRFKSARSFIAAILAVFLLGYADKIATTSTQDGYSSVPGEGDPFVSAAWQNGLATPEKSGRHVVIILVEALGLPAGEVERNLHEKAWSRPSWSTRYQVERGAIRYYGSTTFAELRELCGKFGSYGRFDFKAATCLPEIYRNAGYHATGMHNFTSGLFDRWKWYPQLAFDRIEFAPELIAAGARHCGELFPGACDADVPGIIAQRLKAAKRPQFIYWLTLNSHLPVLPEAAVGTRSCRLGPPSWGKEYPEVCRLFTVEALLADAIDKMVMDPDLPPTDFLIVGDHVPPFLQRESRQRFDLNHVPWIMLRAEGHASRSSESVN